MGRFAVKKIRKLFIKLNNKKVTKMGSIIGQKID